MDLEERGVIDRDYATSALNVDETVRIAWYTRRISDLMPNPFQAARVVQEMVARLRAGEPNSGPTADSYIYRQRASHAAQLRDNVARQMEAQAEAVFRAKLADGQIRFDLETGDKNYRMRESYKLLIAENDKVLQSYGQPMQLSLFEPVIDRDYNGLERKFAFYLDEQKALRWWHRVAARQSGEYYLRGWRRERIWPDFVAMGGETNGRPSLLVFETKGGQLDNPDTEYKKRVFAALEATFNAGKLTIRDGPAQGAFRLVFCQEGFPDAADPISNLSGAYNPNLA